MSVRGQTKQSTAEKIKKKMYCNNKCTECVLLKCFGLLLSVNYWDVCSAADSNVVRCVSCCLSSRCGYTTAYL